MHDFRVQYTFTLNPLTLTLFSRTEVFIIILFFIVFTELNIFLLNYFFVIRKSKDAVSLA